FSLNIMLQPENMAILNTTAAHNDLYYGKAFMTGLAHIHGPVNQIVMDISARTNRGTQIFLPLGYTGDVVENNFITFITKDTTVVAKALAPSELSGVTLNFDLEVTPDAEVQLIFDSQIGDIIRGRGTGNLKFEITSLGSFNMYGDYVIEQGDYLFTLQNLINKRFNIQQGGSIRWAGDPYDADIDLTAAYRLRTPLYDLMMEVDSSDTYRRRVPVETILVLKDKLFNPTITFDINLPGGDETIRETIERLITTEQEMNRQVFSLLVLNRFMPTSTDQYNTALGYGVGSTSSELLSNQLSNWLSQISSDFDIGVNYRPGDEISSQELEVALSTQLFDDRVTIDGNIGVAGNHPASQRTSTLIGDVVVEIKITPEGKFRVKAFNRSNTFDLMNTNSPYTQGVGVFYRKEFDSLGDLLRNNKRVKPDAAYLPEEETGLLEE
ncbi:MAG: translocation/assembly module TamB domain-containing protein, partial [Bacteroidales bacterium]